MSLTLPRRLCAFDVLDDNLVQFMKLLNVVVVAPNSHAYVYLVYGESTHIGGLTMDTMPWCVFLVS